MGKEDGLKKEVAPPSQEEIDKKQSKTAARAEAKASGEKAAAVGADGLFENQEAGSEAAEAPKLLGMSGSDFDKALALGRQKESLKPRGSYSPSRAQTLLSQDARDFFSDKARLDGLQSDPTAIHLEQQFQSVKNGLFPDYPSYPLDRDSRRLSMTGEEERALKAYKEAVPKANQEHLDRFKKLNPNDQAEWIRRETLILGTEKNWGRDQEVRKFLKEIPDEETQHKIFAAIAKERVDNPAHYTEFGPGLIDNLLLDSLEDYTTAYRLLTRTGSADGVAELPLEQFGFETRTTSKDVNITRDERERKERDYKDMNKRSRERFEDIKKKIVKKAEILASL